MIKGKTTIQLFDARTGKELCRQTDENMVTNAIDVIANGKDYLNIFKWARFNYSYSGDSSINLQYSKHCMSSPLFAMLPLAKNALSGILLWDDNITEDPNIMNIPDGVHMLGHAGDSYSGTDNLKGSYNDNESGEIEGGWRHVWDFATDKANGTIKCLSLTSRNGGNVGCYGNYEDKTASNLYNGDLFRSEDNVNYEPRPVRHYVEFECSRKGRIFYIKKSGENTLKLFKRTTDSIYTYETPDLTKINLTQTCPKLQNETQLPITLLGQWDNVFVYDNKINEIYRVSARSLRHRTFTLEGEELSDVTISTERDLYDIYSCAVYRGGYYYCLTNSTETGHVIEKTDPQGEHIATFTVDPYISKMGAMVIDDRTGSILITGEKSNSVGGSDCMVQIFEIDSDDNCRWLTSTRTIYPSEPYWPNGAVVDQIIRTEDKSSPYLYFSDGGYGCRIIPVLNSAYLATINNLQTPIVKTPAQTMKITYEIYDE